MMNLKDLKEYVDTLIEEFPDRSEQPIMLATDKMRAGENDITEEFVTIQPSLNHKQWVIY